MPRLSTLFVPAAASLLLWACASSHPVDSQPKRSAGASGQEMTDDSYEAPPPRRTVPAAMQAKLAHAQAVLEGLVMADYGQVESNALDLRQISERADWLAHDTESYYAFSRKFRTVCDDLVNHSRLKDINALAADYGALTNTCVACHDYLRKERLTKDMPGKVTMGASSHD